MGVIDQFVGRLGLDHVYVSFSGGKDSTVLLDLCRKIYPDIKAVFCNTGNEYPDIVKFVRNEKNSGANIEIIYPKLKPREVLYKYGFPLVSKEVSRLVRCIRNNPNSHVSKRAMGLVANEIIFKLSDKWKYLISEEYRSSEECCQKLKKDPFHNYEKESLRNPILGIMADESQLRKQAYIRQGSCNSFGDNGFKIKSMPLSIWTGKDIWDYIKERNLPISDIYHKGAMRTGCMFCGYGCQFKDDNRLQMVYDLYPKMYETFMNYTNNGVTYREAMRKVLSVNGLYLPDEKPKTLFY